MGEKYIYTIAMVEVYDKGQSLHLWEQYYDEKIPMSSIYEIQHESK